MIKKLITYFFFICCLFCRISAQQIAIDSVSVDPETGEINFGWSVIGSNSFESFTVVNITYEVNPRGTKDPVTANSEVDNDVFSFTYLPSNIIDTSVTYLIWGNFTATDPIESDYHQIVYLTSEFDSCKNLINLTWSNYIGWGDDEIIYEIRDLTTRNIIVTTSELSYTINNIDTETEYSFFIRAVNQADGRTSSSNRTTINTDRPDLPTYLVADHASYADDNNMEVKFTIDPSSEINKYILLRSASENMDNAEILDTINTRLSGEYLINDETDYFQHIYFYQLIAIDGCEKQVQESNPISQIIVDAKASNQDIEIFWNEILNWPQGISYYHVDVTNGDWTLGRDVKNSTNYIHSLDDWISDETYSNEFCINISAFSNQNEVNKTSTSISNTVCITVPIDVFIPSSFTPISSNFPQSNGKNDQLKPLFSFQPTNYRFQIFNKQGAMVFESNSSDETWDGSNVEAGTFVYYLEFSEGKNKKRKLSGTINVIK